MLMGALGVFGSLLLFVVAGLLLVGIAIIALFAVNAGLHALIGHLVARHRHRRASVESADG